MTKAHIKSALDIVNMVYDTTLDLNRELHWDRLDAESELEAWTKGATICNPETVDYYTANAENRAKALENLNEANKHIVKALKELREIKRLLIEIPSSDDLR